MGKVDLQVSASKSGIMDKVHTKGSYMDTKMEWSIKFGKPLKRSTVNSKNMYVTDASNKVLKVSFNYDDKTNTLTMKPLEDYQANTDYFLTVTTRVRALDNSKFSENLVIKFNQMSVAEDSSAEKAEKARVRLEQRKSSGPKNIQTGDKKEVIRELTLSQKYTNNNNT